MASTPSQQWPRGAHLVTSRRNKGNNKSQLRVSPTDRPPRYHKYRPPRKLPNICLSGWQLPSRLAPHRTFQLAIVALPADRFRFLLVGRFRYKNMRALTGASTATRFWYVDCETHCSHSHRRNVTKSGGKWNAAVLPGQLETERSRPRLGLVHRC